jgi:hypothetical protein
MSWNTKGYKGTEELIHLFRVNLYDFNRMFPEYQGLTYKRDKGYRWVGTDGQGIRQPVERLIYFKTDRPSLHKCDGRCRSAKGPNCECFCRGQYHGAGAAS